MESIRNWHDLKEYGIHFLTGEADGVGLRLLCELDPKGHKLVSEYFGNTLTRNADADVGDVVGTLGLILDKLYMQSGNDTRLQWLRRKVRAMAEQVGLVDSTSHFESDGWRELTGNRIGRTMNGPSRYSSTDDQRAGLWSSVMLARDEFRPLAVFCLLHTFDVAIITTGESLYSGAVIGLTFEEWEEYRDRMAAIAGDGYRFYSKSKQPGNGFRNTHAFSGVTEH